MRLKMCKREILLDLQPKVSMREVDVADKLVLFTTHSGLLYNVPEIQTFISDSRKRIKHSQFTHQSSSVSDDGDGHYPKFIDKVQLPHILHSETQLKNLHTVHSAL